MADKDQEEILSQLEKHYKTTKLIYIIQKGDGTPSVQWDPSLTENDVIANLVKALLFMTVDEYIIDMMDALDGDDEDEEDQP